MVMKPVRYTSADFDRYVRGLISNWELAVEQRAEWASIDAEERLCQTEDWPVNNDIHQFLAYYVAQHELTEDQKTQWARLNELVADHITDLEEMGYRVRIPEPGKGRAVA